VSRQETAFWKRTMPEPNSGCWLWTGSCRTDGYGRICVDTKWIFAHRFAYELLVGPIPGHLELDHLCRVRCCVNPDHLEAVTHQTNVDRVPRTNFGKYQRGLTHCPSGHPYEAAYIRKDGSRKCRECHNIKQRQRRQGSRRWMRMRFNLTCGVA
jgi:hypothetical protein